MAVMKKKKKMPIPGLTDIYEFSDWLKKNYIGLKRGPLLIQPIQGGLITVESVPPAVIEGEFKIISHDEIKENENE